MVERMVDAIFEGKIVKVPEGYAVREGMMILGKKREEEAVKEHSLEEIEKKRLEGYVETGFGFDDFRRPLDWKSKQVVRDLIDNFHWHIAKARRTRNMTRKSFADAIGVSEKEVKLIENGAFPFKDYILINKIESVLELKLKANKNVVDGSFRKMAESSGKKRREVLDEGSEIV